MDHQFNDSIRPPDKVKREKLIDDSFEDSLEESLEYSIDNSFKDSLDYSYENELNNAVYLSIKELEKQKEINKKYEEEVVNSFIVKVQERKDKFKDLLFNLKKIINYDKDIKEVYEIIEPIIDSYCAHYFDNVELDSITYDKIFKVIGSVRIDKKIIDLLKEILIKSH
jgi:hypothetical protein